MKILHTADWHIGKKLHNYELAEDFGRFIAWLCDCVQEEQVDVLLISGDCFDLANPSSAARNQYYQSLVKLKKYINQIVITGGNHDSPAVLNAPKELLKALNFDVIGGLPNAIEDALIPLKNRDGKTEAVVAAIPFLRNPDLRKDGKLLKTYEDRLEALRNGITRVFQNAAEACRENYPEIPALAMGHLYAAGIDPSDSERDIQIGNQAAFPASTFDPYFKYVALGHIHKPQRVSAEQPVFYSGSPLPLSFSERQDEKRILIIDTEKNWEPKSIAIPSSRKLLKIAGDFNILETKLMTLPENKGLDNLIELELQEKDYQAKHIHDLEELVDNFQQSGYQIVKHRAKFDNQLSGTGEIFEEHISLEELKPQKVFAELLDRNDFSEKEQRELEAAFLELLEESE